MEPLIVTAHLRSAYAAADPWSPSLEGILAYWALREQLGEEAFSLGMTGHRPLIEPILPLGREEREGDWWWQCSMPLVASAARFHRYTHRRLDLGHAVDRVSERVNAVETKGGPYKAYRNRETVTVARRIAWHCIGERGGVERLLQRCRNVGRGITHGGGEVLRWSVERGGDPAVARFRRPLPVDFALAHGITGPVLDWGIRPPGRAPEHRRRCVMPAPPDGAADGG